MVDTIIPILRVRKQRHRESKVLLNVRQLVMGLGFRLNSQTPSFFVVVFYKNLIDMQLVSSVSIIKAEFQL